MLNRYAARSIVNNLIIAVLAYLLGFYFTSMFHTLTAEIGGMWSVISGVLVMENTAPKTLKSGQLRVIASFIGAFLSGLYLYLFDFSVLGFAVCIGLGSLICHLFRIPSHIKATGVTIAVIMIISFAIKDSNPVLNAALRFGESIIGALVAVLVAYASAKIVGDEDV